MDATTLITELRRPAAWPVPVEQVELLQTHVSLLFLGAGRVYKVKRSVDLGFLDATTLERRRHFCDEELRLNRALAGDTYRRVVPIARRPDGTLAFDAEGEPLEWAVEMHRLPADRMLDVLLERGEVDNEEMNALARRLVEFHLLADTGPGVDEHGTLSAVRRNVLENFEQTACFAAGSGQRATTHGQDPTTHSPLLQRFLEERARGFMESRGELFERRVHEQRIREGHGDLHAGNVCYLPHSLVIYDRLEFSRRLRCGDVACDLAFLAMDLDQRGYSGFGAYLAHRYARLAADPELAELLPFYKSYRAMVRAKVAALSAADPLLDDAAREEKRREAMRYLHLAAGYELPPAVILMCGLPASGKSWLARHLARPFHAVIERSDVRRKILAGVPLREHGRHELEEGLYSREMSERTYRSLLESTVASIEGGRSVVVDATLARAAQRRPFVDAALRLERPVYLVHVTAPEAVIRERLGRRATDASEVSDADPAVYEHARRVFEPPIETPHERVVEVDSSTGPPEELAARVIERRIACEAQA